MFNAVTFIVFGAVLLGPALEHLSWPVLAYATLSLTVVRMVPVTLSLLGTHARAPTLAFLGWFGPRGPATIVFVILSVLAHGVTAAPLADRYAAWFRRHPRPERKPAHEA